MSENLIIKFEKAPDYKRCHATGFYGGINPFGELVFDITEDIVEPPDEIELVPHDTDPSIRVEKPIQKETQIKRMQHVQVTLPISAVPSIIEWMKEKLSQVQK